MKKILIKIIYLIIFFIILISIKNTVQANSINKIDMQIYIEDNGDALVQETWSCYANKGTEVYHPYYNLGNSRITNLKVRDGIKEYTTLNSWNTSGTIDSKAYKCGLNIISNGVEICWGISAYGSKTYRVEYTITNFVSQLSDAQMVYWTLIPYDFSDAIGDVKIKIYSDKYFEDTIGVWGYGKYGALCYVNDGSIYMDSEGTLKKSEYMTILAKFPTGTFNTNNELPYSFNHYLDMSQEGATKYEDDEPGPTLLASISVIFYAIIRFIPYIIVLIIGVFTAKSKKFGFDYGKLGKKIPKDVAYYRDIPCDGNIFRIYYIAYQYGMLKNKTDILGAIILKWIKEGIVRIENIEKKKIFSREETVIVLGEDKVLGNQKETELYHMMYIASKDGVLENREFESWCKKSYEKILGWFDNILEEQRTAAVIDNLITVETGGLWGQKYIATPELKNYAMAIAGLKRYMLDYTLLKDRGAIEVNLFEEYMICAQILGIAKQVAKQFKELYPDIIEQSHYSSVDNIMYINYCSSRGVSSANSARAAAQSYSSGGGGFSSGGGGGGSFGGGGGRRRFPLIYK